MGGVPTTCSRLLVLQLGKDIIFQIAVFRVDFLPRRQALDFAVSDPFYSKYIYASEGFDTEAQFTIRAIGDLDCDGVFSTFERIGTVNDENEVEGAALLYSDKELE